MGRRSINTTKSGKFMNPTDQARKEARKRELKKNKKQRMMVRQAVLKGKDPMQLIVDMKEIDEMEFDPTQPPRLNEKVLKDKRRKLVETLERVITLYSKEDPAYSMDLKKTYSEYEKGRVKKQLYFEQVKSAEHVQLAEIPLPDGPTAPALPGDIPLPLDIPTLLPAMASASDKPFTGILKKPPVVPPPKLLVHTRKPPGPPPGPPPPLSDSEDDYDPEKAIEENLDLNIETGTLGTSDEALSSILPVKQKKIRFHSDVMPNDDEEDTNPKMKPAVSELQMKMLKIAGQEIPMVAEDKKVDADMRDDAQPQRATKPTEPSMDSSVSSTDKNNDEVEDRERKQESKMQVTGENDDGTTVTPTASGSASALVAPGTHSRRLPDVPPGPPAGLPPGVSFLPPPLGGATPVPPPLRGLLPPGPPPGRPPMLFPPGTSLRPPAGAPVAGSSTGGMGLPPGPPPGLPPRMPPTIPPVADLRLPPRMMAPPLQLDAPGTVPLTALHQTSAAPTVTGGATTSARGNSSVKAANPTILSAPPSIMKQSSTHKDKSAVDGSSAPSKSGPTISAKPQIKHTIGDVTRFMPTSLKVKREVRDSRGRVIARTAAATGKDSLVSSRSAAQVVPQQAKGDAYDLFMQEMQDFL